MQVTWMSGTISSPVTKKKGYPKVYEVKNVSNVFVKCDGLKFRDCDTELTKKTY